MSKIRWGILGTGGIARQFAAALAESPTGELAAVGSRAQQTAEAFGEEFGVARRHASYDGLLADGEVDAVYNALPNHLHLGWTVKAARAGKHVLCEKPLTVNAAEAERMIAAVRQTDAFLMEAFMYRCHPQTARLVELVGEGAVGEVRVIEATFGYDMGDSDQAYENIRLRRDVAGGGIMDVGCYTMSMARLIAGAAAGLSAPAEPEHLAGAAHIGPRGEVDEWAGAVVRFPGDVVANLVCACRCGAGSVARVWGSGGSIEVPNPWKPVTGKIILRRRGKEPEDIEMATEVNCYTLEADVLAESLPAREAAYPCMTWDDSLGNMRALDRWRQAVGLSFDADRDA